jgi:O-antigen ligase
LVAGALGIALFRFPLLNLAAVLFGFAFLITAREGVQVFELVFGLYYLAYVALWYLNRLVLQREPLCPYLEDKLAALLLVFGLGGGILLGILFGFPAGSIRGDAVAFSMLLLYFPAREACARERWGPAVVFGSLMWYGTYVTIRNAINFREAFLSATAAIEVAGARAALNEMHLLVGSLSMFLFLVLWRERRLRPLFLAAFAIFFSALLMTKARGFWVDFLFGLGVLFLIVRNEERRRMALLGAIGAASVAIIAFVFFGDFAVLLFEGVLSRFATLETAVTKDISLVNRFNEASAVFDRVIVNPVLGYGLGAEFRFFNWIYKHTAETSFIHNGYVALWFKLGLGGALLMLAFWARTAWIGIQTYRSSGLSLFLRVLALCAALSLIAIIPSVSTSAPFFVDDSMLSFTLLTALSTGLYERWRTSKSLSMKFGVEEGSPSPTCSGHA